MDTKEIYYIGKTVRYKALGDDGLMSVGTVSDIYIVKNQLYMEISNTNILINLNK